MSTAKELCIDGQWMHFFGAAQMARASAQAQENSIHWFDTAGLQIGKGCFPGLSLAR